MGASRLRLVGVGVVVVALMALTAARADAGATYVHSAHSGTSAGGRLTLHGVGRKVTWITNGGRSGVAPISFVQKRAFLRKAPATGVLHIAGQRGGQEFTFKLSAPRYSAASGTASYRARRLTKNAVAVPRHFGAASLSVAPASPGSGLLGSGAPGSGTLRSGDNGGNDCLYSIWNPSPGNDLTLLSSSKWDTDDWAPPPPATVHLNDTPPLIGTEGGFLRGCHNETVWQAGTYQGAPTITIDVTWPWTQLPTSTCTPSNPRLYQCYRADQNGEIDWVVNAI